MKKLSVIAAAVLMMAGCTKQESRTVAGRWQMFNDHGNTVIELKNPGFLEIEKADTFFAGSNYSGQLIGSAFTMPAGVWGNDEAVTGSWRWAGDFLEFYYVGVNKDSATAQYIPTKIYEMDFIK